MRNFLKTGVALLVTLFSIQAVMAQDFPATEAEVKELITKKWAAKQLIMGENKIDASAMNLEATMTVNKDMTYTMTFMGETLKGKWSIDMAKKTITFFDEDGKAETLVKSLKKDELVAEPADDEEEDMKMIFIPAAN